MPDAAVEASYHYCRQLARSTARNFYYGFVLLPDAKRDALCALYAFMRGIDDISDEPGPIEVKRQRLQGQRAELDRILDGGSTSEAAWPALRDTVKRFGIPPRYLHDLITGAEMDLAVAEYETFGELRRYCYHVAGAVGLCCLYVFGFRDTQAPEFAEKLGIAFQLTNILRDIREDLAMGRVYLPHEDFAKFGCKVEQFSENSASGRAIEMLDFETKRARDFYCEGWKLLPLVNADSRAALWAMARIYSGILQKIERRGKHVLTGERARLSAAEKMWIVFKARMGWFRDDGT
ncbi:MAG TPA: phytoene/squalene synthase family protein [Candidatus Acidoferrales bacterium]|nr:phytoene/squalene synthase family protein [Candidatus Acidoferrales bacterium]